MRCDQNHWTSRNSYERKIKELQEAYGEAMLVTYLPSKLLPKQVFSAPLHSMSRKENCWDNAPMESFFNSLKDERVFREITPYRKKLGRICLITFRCFITGDVATPRCTTRVRHSIMRLGYASKTSGLMMPLVS